ncbi:low-density lipoprotein receptor-related protein [Elysia marginata]|uniref:Low-density lipoprotein receptor-related protein n=1 Tax=Elysia marginata TaxID=1093978 RepID=A0AAV4IJP4_9GAST|nr:low-density lipoprotein receptor-related protein [Elysia marginata]
MELGLHVDNIYKFHLEPRVFVNCQMRETCPLDQFRCDNGECIPGMKACDYLEDCSDGSDEHQCRLEIIEYPKQRGYRDHYLSCEARGGAEFHETIHWFLQRPGQYHLVNITHHLEQQQQQGQHSDHMATRMIFFSKMIERATEDLAPEDGVYVRYRLDGSLLKLRRLQAHTKTQERLIRDLLFADDAAIVAHTEQALQRITSCFAETSSLFGLEVSLKKT